jgi:hypothetical protein
MTDKPKAEFVGHTAVDPGSYTTYAYGNYTRLGKRGTWTKCYQLWEENGKKCGAWFWEQRT